MYIGAGGYGGGVGGYPSGFGQGQQGYPGHGGGSGKHGLLDLMDNLHLDIHFIGYLLTYHTISIGMVNCQHYLTQFLLFCVQDGSCNAPCICWSVCYHFMP